MSTSFPLLDFIDICERKHRGSPESIDAHDRIVNSKAAIYARIMPIFVAREEYGATSHEISAATGIPLQTISARLSELRHTLKWLEKKGERRNNAAVLVEANRGYAV